MIEDVVWVEERAEGVACAEERLEGRPRVAVELVWEVCVVVGGAVWSVCGEARKKERKN